MTKKKKEQFNTQTLFDSSKFKTVLYNKMNVCNSFATVNFFTVL